MTLTLHQITIKKEKASKEKKREKKNQTHWWRRFLIVADYISLERQLWIKNEDWDDRPSYMHPGSSISIPMSLTLFKLKSWHESTGPFIKTASFRILRSRFLFIYLTSCDEETPFFREQARHCEERVDLECFRLS